MKHVFVETNWVVAYAAPAHLQLPAALGLAQRAAAGELQLYIPSVCLTESRYPIRTKFHPRSPADSVRKYLGWATAQRKVPLEEVQTVRRVLEQYEATVTAELEDLDERLRALTNHPGVEVFALRDEMLARTIELSTQNLDLKPFDQAILATVLVRAEELRDQGEHDISFCELDGDLQPWDKNGRSKQPLTALYDSAQVWVYGDFAMENPARRPGFQNEGPAEPS
jgi:hypothetical protein